jgi:hypothetical protein
MPDLKGLKVGDPIMVPKGWGHRVVEYEERTVSKVGRLWLSVGDGWEARRFRIASGTEEDNHGRHALTIEQHAEIPLREAAVATFVGLKLPGARYEIERWVETLSLEAIEKIVAVLDPTYFGQYAELYAGSEPKGAS